VISVGDFLRGQASNGSAWNCSTLPADWCMALGHPDFAAAWREVTDPTDCAAFAANGLLDLWDVGIGDALPVVNDLEAGDIAVLKIHWADAGAIYTGERWALRRPRGLFVAAPEMVAVVKAWRP